MANVASNRGKLAILATYFQNGASYVPPGFKIALITAAGAGTSGTPVVPTQANVLSWSDVSANEIPAGNGYTAGGQSLGRNATDWSTMTEDDANNRAIAGLRDITWTATGGTLPASGTGAAYAVVYDTTAGNNVVAIYDLGGNRVVSDSQQLILQGFEYILT